VLVLFKNAGAYNLKKPILDKEFYQIPKYFREAL